MPGFLKSGHTWSVQAMPTDSLPTLWHLRYVEKALQCSTECVYM